MNEAHVYTGEMTWIVCSNELSQGIEVVYRGIRSKYKFNHSTVRYFQSRHILLFFGIGFKVSIPQHTQSYIQ